MSGSSGISDLAAFPGGIASTTIAHAASVARKLSALTQQVSDGYIADTYAGLGNGLRTALVTAPAIAQQQAWQSNIAAATGAMQVAQTALAQISSIASTFYAASNNLNGLNPSEVNSVAASARDALVQMAGLLNSTDGANYVFSGQDTTNPPVPNGDAILSSGFYSQIQTAVAGLGVNGGSATVASTLAIATSNAAGTSPFSAYLSQPASALALLRPVAIAAGGQPVPTSVVASANGDTVSGGASTTGSYTRDIMRALATLGSLRSTQTSDAGFSQVVADTYASLGGAITALNADAGVLGNRQTQMQAESQAAAATVTALQSQLSNAQDVDMATALSRLTQTQTQLQASYQLISDSQSLSLIKYLSLTGG